MKQPRNQVFLERRSYRLRRLGDAARLLPVLGLILVLLPIFWGAETTGTLRLTASDGVYLFAVWCGLIIVAAFLSRKLVGMSAATDPSETVAAPAVFPDQRMGE
jgi:hypothetical protein